jgi:2-polyprenyl-3-methyl-5-hydroxy-6-metoxy-1,4-benzoquinol methylase
LPQTTAKDAQNSGMILHQLIWLHRNYKKNAPVFFELQARDAIQWLEQGGVHIGPGTQMLDLGCGHGYPGKICAEAGAEVTYADYEDLRLEELKNAPFHQIDLNESELEEYGQFDLVMCSNVLEHLSNPNQLIQNLPKLLKPNGVFYLSWTNWLSPWGGHEFSPWHYLGKTSGSIHTVGENLFKTYIGHILKTVHAQQGLSIQRMAPRYYNELGFLMQLPGLREFLAWNCALQIQRSTEAHSSS